MQNDNSNNYMKNATLEDAVTGVSLHERIVKELKTYEMKKVITNLC